MRPLRAAAFLLMVSGLLSTPRLTAQPRTLDARLLTWATGLEVGVGYDPVKLAIFTDPCVTFQAEDVKRFNIDPGDQNVSWQKVVTSSDHISNMFKFTYAESMDAGIFSGGFNFAMTNNVTYDTSHIRLLAYRRILQGDTKIIQNVALRPEAAKLLGSDYASFRTRCGDYYVSGYALGGEYYGTIDVDKSALGLTLETEASMSEKMNGLFSSESTDASVQDAFDRLSKHGALTVNEASRGGHLPGATSVASVKKNYREFDASVTAAPYKVKVIISPYSQLITTDTGTILPNVAQMEDNAALHYEYQTLFNSLAAILKRPFQYSLKTPLGSEWNTPAIQKMMAEISDTMDKIAAVRDVCSTPAGRCPAMRTVLTNLPSTYADRIPAFLGSPQTCGDVQRRSAAPKDGMARLFYQGDPDQPFDVVCLGMATTYPREYLPLRYYQPPDASGNGANYSQASLHPGNPVLVTTFTALRIDPQSLIVTLDDFTYATSNGVFVAGPDLKQEPYASPFACDRHVCDWMRADIDFRSMPFAVDEGEGKTKWAAIGSHAPEDGGGTKIGTDDNKKFTITSPCGDCAWLAPTPLVLKYVGNYIPMQTLLRAAPPTAVKTTTVPRRGRAQ